MHISLESKSKLGKYIKINSKEQNTHLYLQELDPAIFKDTGDIELLVDSNKKVNKRSDKGGMVISSPGEFEKDGVFVWAQRNKTEGSEIDFVEIEAERVRVLYTSTATEIKKDLLSDLGLIDVMILKVEEKFDQQVKSVSAIDPQILIPIFTEGVDKDKFKKEVGSKFEEEKKLKCKASDFTNEDYVTQGIILEQR
jgi:hypothetical protein